MRYREKRINNGIWLDSNKENLNFEEEGKWHASSGARGEREPIIMTLAYPQIHGA